MPSACFSGSIDPEKLFSANHQSLQKICPEWHNWAWTLQRQIWPNTPFSPWNTPFLGGFSKLVKIHPNRIGSKFTCGLEGPILAPEKIFSSNGAILAKFGTNRIFQLDNFSWGRTFKNLKNSKIEKFRKFSPNKCSRVKRPSKAQKRCFQRV